MQITIQTRKPVDTTIELSPEDIETLRLFMAHEFLSHVRFHDYRSTYQGQANLEQIEFCQKFGVDPELDSERIAFFETIVRSLMFRGS
jgi:hypothetical protein